MFVALLISRQKAAAAFLRPPGLLFIHDVKELSVIQNNFLLASTIEVGEDVFPWYLCTIDSAVRLKTVGEPFRLLFTESP